MADKTSNGASGRSDLDPFAELTRIMGFDPRVPVEPSNAAAAKPADADTSPPHGGKAAEPEEDLGIDLEQELLGAPDEAEPVADEAPTPVEAVAAEAEEPAGDIDLQGIEDEISAHVDEFIAADRADEPLVEAADEDEDSATEPEIELDLAADDRFEDEAEIAASEEVDLDRSLEDAFADTRAPQPAVAHDAGWDPAPFLSARPKPMPVADDAAMADVDMDFDGGADTNGAPASAELEAEYNALLGNTSKSAETITPSETLASKQRDAEIRTASIVSAGWRKPATAFADQDRYATADHAEDGPGIDPDLADALEAAAAEPASPEAQPVAAKSEPVYEDPFAALAAMAARYQTGPQENSWRETASKYEAPRAPAVDATQQPQAKSYGAPAPRPAMPDIETVDVHDHAVALADDLNIPEIGYDEPAVNRYDDLDAEFNNLLNEMSTGERREPAQQSYAPVQRQAAYVEQRPAPTPRPQPAPQPVRAQPAAPPAYRNEHAAYHDDNRYGSISDQDFERAMAAFEAEADDDENEEFRAPLAPIAQKRPRRGLMLAAIVGGLALIGGISVVALSFGGSSLSEIAMIKADNKPVKVRPENPGGSTVPNQASSVYDTVSRSGAAQPPTQERLVNTAEEPLDLPLPNDAESEEVVDDVAAMAKDEDRVEPTAETEVANQETIAVAPRRVRTMVVKSDGTLVARVEPVAEEPAAAAPQAAAVEDEAGTESITTGATSPSAPAAPQPEKVAALATAMEKPETAPVAGAWAVQVSSQPSEDGANKSLKDISRKYASVIGSRGANIVKAEVDGKGTMYRVRISASSRDEAISLCGDLKAAGGSCFVTK